MRSFPPWLAAGALLLLPGISMSDAVRAPAASASLQLRIIVPPSMRVLENSHPSQLDRLAGGDWSAEQRLVVVSNMKRGFCLTLRMSTPEVDTWRLQTEEIGGVTLSPVDDGYRLCTPRAGRYTLLLRHDFEAASDHKTQALHWPVRTDITAL